MKKKFFKNKIQMVVYLFLFALFLFGFIYFGSKDYSNNNITEEDSSIVTFAEDSIYESINSTDALNFIKRKNIIILFAKDNDFVNKYSEIVEEVAKKNNIEKIYYYDIENDREEDNASYRSLVEYLSNNINYFEGDTSEIYAPTLMIKQDGVVTYFDNSAAITKGKYTVDEYFSKYIVNSLSEDLTNVFIEYNEGVNNGK